MYSLVANLAHFEESAAGADVGLLDLVGAVDDGGTRRLGHSVLVRLAQAAESRDAGLYEVVLGQIRDALLSYHYVWLEGHDLWSEQDPAAPTQMRAPVQSRMIDPREIQFR